MAKSDGLFEFTHMNGWSFLLEAKLIIGILPKLDTGATQIVLSTIQNGGVVTFEVRESKEECRAMRAAALAGEEYIKTEPVEFHGHDHKH